MSMPWRATTQSQTEHLGDYCTLSTAIRVDDGEIAIHQRIRDDAEGYDHGRQRVATIIRAVNAHDALVTALREALAIFDGEMGSDWADHFGPFYEQARAALALAESQP